MSPTPGETSGDFTPIQKEALHLKKHYPEAWEIVEHALPTWAPRVLAADKASAASIPDPEPSGQDMIVGQAIDGALDRCTRASAEAIKRAEQKRGIGLWLGIISAVAAFVAGGSVIGSAKVLAIIASGVAFVTGTLKSIQDHKGTTIGGESVEKLMKELAKIRKALTSLQLKFRISVKKGPLTDDARDAFRTELDSARGSLEEYCDSLGVS